MVFFTKTAAFVGNPKESFKTTLFSFLKCNWNTNNDNKWTRRTGFTKHHLLSLFFDEQTLKINRSDRFLLFCFTVVLIHPSLIQLQKGRTSNRIIRASLLSSPENNFNKKKKCDRLAPHWKIYHINFPFRHDYRMNLQFSLFFYTVFYNTDNSRGFSL